MLLWLLTVLGGVAMAGAGAAKFVGADFWTGAFAGWGYPAGFAYVVGAVEVVGGLALLVPRLAAWAGMSLVAVLLGAVVTLVLHPGGAMTVGPALVYMTAIGVVSVVRWPDRWRPGQA